MELDLASKNCSTTDLHCKNATEALIQTSALLTEYENKKSISPEMEENVRNIVLKLKAQKSTEMAKATKECSKTDHSSVVDSGREISIDKKSPDEMTKKSKSSETIGQ